MVDGGDIRDMHLQRFRSFIGVVGQEPVLFDCSIRDNIAYGLDTDVGMDEIIEAARMANIHEFIVNRPTVSIFTWCKESLIKLFDLTHLIITIVMVHKFV